ncbi:40S ribosomal protein SA [Prionailurus iriomotensis]
MYRNSLRPLSGHYYPFGGLNRGSRTPVFSGVLSTPVFGGELLKRHRGTCLPAEQVWDRRWSSHELRSRSSPFILKFFLVVTFP